MAVQLDLNFCDKACLGCIKSYKKKHTLSSGKFEIRCSGIPKDYLSADLRSSLSEDEQHSALGVLDPVTWASENLDWHCLDPDGEIWKRKNPKEYNDWIKEHPGESIYGKSRYHRPYQAEMLRCTAQNKVFRIGRQAGKTECLVVSMLYNMFVKPGKGDQGFKIVLITPFQAQIDLIFGRLNELISGNNNLTNSIARSVKAPQYSIELFNGSVIKGFTAGTKSGGNADSVRGQSADMLVFDEADYLSSGDLESALAIIINFPNATIWMSSTPTGRREKFYETCHSRQFKEYHYPSYVNPLWNERMESSFKEQYSELAYKHEVLAEFGDQEEGVFQNTYVQAAKSSYEYASIPRGDSWIYTIGVDWNDTKNGTTIAVAGLNPSTNTFYIVDKAIVTKEGWTQLTACERIAELNRIWEPTAIYIDYGHGGTQYEILRKFGFDSSLDPAKGPMHPDARIKDILKQYNFGSKIETHDLFTKQPIEKSAKPFLVENTVRRFETKSIKFPSTDTKLEAQLQNYIIDRVTVAGVPVYKPRSEEIGDHFLDAVMLSLVAFTLEKTAFGKPVFRNDVSFSGYFGQKTEPEKPSPGDLIVKDDRKIPPKSPVITNRPTFNRTEGVVGNNSVLGSDSDSLPANNTTSNGQLSLWAWPGFERDAPRPRSGFRTGRSGPPVRKKI